jgi:N-acetylated-alpha-linked acidic dipeptidase
VLTLFSILASWDAEEFGLMGSTEWVEDHLPELIEKTVAYINLDTAVSGPRAEIVGSGEIQTIAIETMKKVIFPEGYGAGPTLYDAWYNATEGVLPAMGSGSDYAAFYHNGISSVRIFFPFNKSVYLHFSARYCWRPWPQGSRLCVSQPVRHAPLDD